MVTVFNREKFDRFIFDNEIVGFVKEPLTLSSGRKTHWYANWRGVNSDVFLLDKLSDFVLAFLAEKKIRFDCIYGTPDGVTKLAVLCQYKWAKKQAGYGPNKFVVAMGRKIPKDHGDPQDRYFVGAPRGRVVVLEDVTTTGGSLLKSVETLLAMKTKVVAAVALTNRNELNDDREHISEVLKAMGVEYCALSNGLELLPQLIQLEKINSRVVREIVKEFEVYGTSSLQLR